MERDRDIIENVFHKLIELGYHSVADIINDCCFWSSAGSLHKVKLCLYKCLKNGGFYKKPGTVTVIRAPIVTIRDAFTLLSEEAEKYNVKF